MHTQYEDTAGSATFLTYTITAYGKLCTHRNRTHLNLVSSSKTFGRINLHSKTIMHFVDTRTINFLYSLSYHDLLFYFRHRGHVIIMYIVLVLINNM